MAATVRTAVENRWLERLRRWKSSGWSIADFCRQEQVSQQSFFHWRKRLKREAAKAPAKPQFVELLPPAWVEPAELRIALPGGVVVHVPQSSSMEVITAVVRAAMASADQERPC